MERKSRMVWGIFCKGTFESAYGYIETEAEARAKCRELNEWAEHTVWAEGRKYFHIEQVLKPWWQED